MVLRTADARSCCAARPARAAWRRRRSRLSSWCGQAGPTCGARAFALVHAAQWRFRLLQAQGGGQHTHVLCRYAASGVKTYHLFTTRSVTAADRTGRCASSERHSSRPPSALSPGELPRAHVSSCAAHLGAGFGGLVVRRVVVVPARCVD